MQPSGRIVLSSAIVYLFVAWPSAPAAEADLAKDSQTGVSTGKKFPELKPFDELMEAFVRDNKIPGA